jgi:hypothetical protein
MREMACMPPPLFLIEADGSVSFIQSLQVSLQQIHE